MFHKHLFHVNICGYIKAKIVLYFFCTQMEIITYFIISYMVIYKEIPPPFPPSFHNYALHIFHVKRIVSDIEDME